MINFELDDEQQLIRDTVVSFARDEVRPHARESDEKGHSPADLVQKGWELGLVQSAIPEEFGGFGSAHSATTGAVVAEELAYGDLSIAMHLLAPRLVTVPVIEFGSPALRVRTCEYLAASSLAIWTVRSREPFSARMIS